MQFFCNLDIYGKAMMMDDRDRLILSALAENAWLTYGELGDRIHLSASATQRRVERLIETGMIEGARAQIAPAAIGRPVKLFVLVELTNESKASIAAFSRKLATSESVVGADYLAGAADILIEMQTADMAEYADFCDRNLNTNPGVRKYKTLTVLKRLC